jgi:DUF4097 and DUF4098 domain-containing protein YvlB/uncharacterized membrane protein HdeD (DUF308 family)
MFKRIATFLFGVALVSLGILFFIAPERSFLLQILVRYWPVFLILAGIVRLGGYLLDRQPRSPMGALLLSTAGGILLSANLRGESRILEIFGRYWFFLLLAYVIGRVLRQYGHRPEEGAARIRAFSPGAVTCMALILGGGLLSHAAARDQRILGNLRLPASIGNVREIFGVRATSEDRVETAFALGRKSRLLFVNLPASLEVRRGAADAPRAVLTRRVQGKNENEAREALPKINLRMNQRGGDYLIDITTDDPNLEFTSALLVEIPKGFETNIDATALRGDATLTGLTGNHIIRDAEAISIGDNTGGITLENPRGNVRLTNITGRVELKNARRETTISRITGPVTLDLGGGRAVLEKMTGAISASARTTTIEARDIRSSESGEPLEFRNLSDCRLTLGSVAGRVVVDAERTRIEIDDMSGDLQIRSTSERARLGRVAGQMQVTVDGGSVEAFDLQGSIEIEATREVTVRNVRGSLSANTTLGAVVLEFDDRLPAEVRAVSRYGAIRVSLPETAVFGLDAETSFGRLRVRGFDEMGLSRNLRPTSVNYRPEGAAALLTLRSVNGDITLTSSGGKTPARSARRARRAISVD